MGLFGKPDVDKLKKAKNVGGLVKALKDKDKFVRLAAARALIDVNGPKAVPPLINALKTDDFIRCVAARALGAIRDTRAIEPLAEALRSKDHGDRVCAADALGEINDPRAIGPLLGELIDGGKVNVYNIDMAASLVKLGWKPANETERILYDIGAMQWDELVKIGPSATDLLISALNCKNTDLLCGAVRALGRIGDERAVNAISALLARQDNWQVKKAGNEVLENLDPVKLAAKGDNAKLADLLKKNPNANIKDKDGKTPLIMAAWGGHIETVRLLIDNGADVNLPDKYYDSPLMYSVKINQPEITRLLLERGADANAVSRSYGETALLKAASHSNLEAVRLLLAKGANVNAKNTDGFTALIRAAQEGATEIVKLLLESGADVNARGNFKTAMMWAEQEGYREIVELLSAKGAKINEKVSIKELVRMLKSGDAQEALNAGQQLAQLGSFEEMEQVFRELGDTGKLARLRMLKNSGQWHDGDIGLLMLELTKSVLQSRGFM